MPARAPADADTLRLQFLVLRGQAGDEAAFARLYAEFAPRTLAYARTLVGTDADDVQQETWLAVFRYLRGLQDPRAFRLWLFRTTRHHALNWLRRHRRERELQDDVPLEDLAAGDDGDEGAGDRLDVRLDADLLESAMARLPPPQREVLRLRYRDDLSLAQIALIAGVPVGTIKTRLHHARRRLQALLTPETDHDLAD